MSEGLLRRLPSTIALGGILALAGPLAAAIAGDPPAAAPAGGSYEPFTVKKKDLHLTIGCDGRVDGARRAKVRYIATGFFEPVRVVSVSEEARRGDPVGEGAVLVTLDGSRLADAIRAATEARDATMRKLEESTADERTARDADRVRLERAEKAASDAKKGLDQFEKIDGPRMLRESELDVKNHEADVEDREQELSQLEEMYKGTHLASETKEIVILRARRWLERSRAYLDIARTSERETRELNVPNQLASLRENARWAAADLENARTRVAIDSQRRQDEVAGATIAARDARERLEKLEADRAALTIRAPAAGVVAGLGLAPGDLVRPDDVVAEVVDPRPLVRVEVAARDRPLVAPGSRGTVLFPEIPSLRASGEIVSLAPLGRPGERGTRFDATIALAPGVSVPLGIQARFECERTIEGALVVPRGAVATKGGRSYCRLAPPHGAGARASAPPPDPGFREVTLGAGDDDEVAVLAGLGEGDEIVIHKAEGKLVAPEVPAKAETPAAAPATSPADEKPLRDATPPAGAKPKGPLVRASPAEAFERGLRYLVSHQNADGSWGSFESSRPDEIMTGTIASFPAWQEATTALCALALLAPSRSDPAARAALERALDQLVAAPPTARATGDVFYDTWTHVYLVEALSACARDERLAGKRAAIAAVVEREIGILRSRQGADGGFGYYDFGYALTTPSGHESTSFLTAAAVLALDAAADAGFRVDQAMVDDALGCIARLRLPSGAYVYGTYAQQNPNALYNWVKGSLGRSQPCNLALWRHEKGVSEKDLAAGLEALEKEHKFIAIGQGRPIPHEAWYYTAGYYYLFGHYYAARVAHALGGEVQAEFARWLGRTLVDCQGDDGAWLDFPMYGYGRAYGTAYALLAMEACGAQEQGAETR
jgi:multidrug resistance efflux pump